MVEFIATTYNNGVAPPPETLSHDMVRVATTVDNPISAFTALAKLCNKIGTRTFFTVTTQGVEVAELGELCMKTGQLQPCDRFTVCAAQPRVLVMMSMRTADDGIIVNAFSMGLT